MLRNCFPMLVMTIVLNGGFNQSASSFLDLFILGGGGLSGCGSNLNLKQAELGVPHSEIQVELD